jgi:response regulator RpfG family c-di-GMP phosphodiesterase
MNKRSILYVDDEVDNLTVFKSTFRREYTIHLAESGAEGIEILKNNEIQIIISDQRMPEMTGTQFLESVKPVYPDCVSMILTGFSDVEAIIEAINKGKVYRYITKPWNKDELRQTINDAFESFELKVKNKNLIEELKITNKQLEKDLYDCSQKIEAQ